jgi:cation diffusion facilitator CzcD-associated flavoprotein CzcO
MANWLEIYADALEINLWLSSFVSNAFYDDKKRLWNVVVKRPGKPKRLFQVKHVVFATGIGAGKGAIIPDFKGKDVFKGQILHSMNLKTVTEHIGKKVVVIGACTSGAWMFLRLICACFSLFTYDSARHLQRLSQAWHW